MSFFNWLFGKKVKAASKEPVPTTVRPRSESMSGFYVPDTRSPEEHDALKKKYLRPEAEAVANGACGVGQADNERSILEFDKYITGVKYSAILDNACCPECWPLDGETFSTDLEGRPSIPRHEGCRCLYLMKTRTWEDFGIDLSDLPSDGRPWVLAEYQYVYKKDPTKKLKKPRRIIREVGHFHGTAEQWIHTLPTKEQRQFFATDLAYSLWVNGKARGIDLLDDNTWRLRSDDELRRLFDS